MRKPLLCDVCGHLRSSIYFYCLSFHCPTKPRVQSSYMYSCVQPCCKSEQFKFNFK